MTIDYFGSILHFLYVLLVCLVKISIKNVPKMQSLFKITKATKERSVINNLICIKVTLTRYIGMYWPRDRKKFRGKFSWLSQLPYVFLCIFKLTKGRPRMVHRPDLAWDSIWKGLYYNVSVRYWPPILETFACP